MSSWLLTLAFFSGVVVTAIAAAAAHRLRRPAAKSGPGPALLERASAHAVCSEHAEAAALLRQALEAGAGDSLASVLLVDQYLRAGDPARGALAAEVVLARRDLSPSIRGALLFLRGRVLERSARPEEALLHYAEAADLFPNSPAPHAAAERLLGKLGRHAEAVEAARRFVRLAPEAGKAVLARRLALLAAEELVEGRPESALNNATLAAETAPLGAAHLLRGDALWQKGMIRAARDAWRESLKLSPGLLPVVLERLDQAGEEGREVLRQMAREAGETTPRLWAWFGYDAQRRGAQGEARSAAAQLLHAAPGSAAAQRLAALTGAGGFPASPATEIERLLARWAQEPPWPDPWRCRHCSWNGESFTLVCPGCGAWESLQ